MREEFSPPPVRSQAFWNWIFQTGRYWEKERTCCTICPLWAYNVQRDAFLLLSVFVTVSEISSFLFGDTRHLRENSAPEDLAWLEHKNLAEIICRFVNADLYLFSDGVERFGSLLGFCGPESCCTLDNWGCIFSGHTVSTPPLFRLPRAAASFSSSHLRQNQRPDWVFLFPRSSNFVSWLIFTERGSVQPSAPGMNRRQDSTCCWFKQTEP